MAALGEVPFGRYYGSVDATPLFVMLAGAYCAAHRRPAPHPRAVAAHRARAGLDRRATATATATASSSTRAAPRPASPTRAGRIRTTRSSTPTAAWPRARSRCARCRATSTPPSAWPPRCARRLGQAERAAALRAQAEDAARSASRRRSGARRSAPTRWRSTATSGPAGCAPATPAMRCSPASPRRDAPRALPTALLHAAFYSGWGIRTVAPRRGALQPDVLPQRLDLAARQRADRAGPGALRLQARRRRACSTGLVRATSLHGPPPHARAVLRLPRAGRAAAPRSIRSRARRRPGPRARRSSCCRRCWVCRSITAARQYPPGQPCRARLRRRRHRAQSRRSAAPAWISSLCQDGEAVSVQVLRTRGDLQVSLVFNAHSADG